MNLSEFKKIKNSNIYKFVDIYKFENSKELALKLSKHKMLPARAIAEQVSCYQKCKTKLPNLRDKNILFESVALEQASSETTANYKASLISGNKIIDLTGGLGIDDLSFVTRFNRTTYCELSEVVYEIFKYNIEKLKILNVEVNNTDSIEYLTSKKNNFFDWIYIDPSRRNKNRRSVDLKYCTPNVYDNMELFFKKSKNVMIKVAPAFDLTEAAKRFPNLYEIHVVSVDGECKEVLLLLNNDIKSSNPKVFAVKLNSKNDKTFIISSDFKNNLRRKVSELGAYFYEPDCSIIKSDLTPLLSAKLDLSFVNKSTLYLTNSNEIERFPGRSFLIIEHFTYNEKIVKKYLKDNRIFKANISKRGFRMSVDEIRAKFKLKDGGDIYIFFTLDINKKNLVVITRKYQ